MRAVSFYALLALGLLLDGAQIFRLVLVCALLHELGHVVIYTLCARRLPGIRASAGGLCLVRQPLSRRAEVMVLCAGPAVNFLLFGALLWRAQIKASYDVYFLAAVSLCVGLYNLLPIGVLDGAQLWELLLPARLLGAFHAVQQELLLLFCVGALGCAVFCPLSATLRVALFIASGYLFLQNAANP